MICDTLQHLTRYKGLCKNLDTAIDYLLTHDPASLPLGRTEVDGEEVFINTMDATLHSDDGYHPEYHKKYADLQLDITGMTGGQMAPTTLLGMKTSTCPYGRQPDLHGYPLQITQIAASLQGTCYVTRQAVHNVAAIHRAKKALRKAFENSLKRRGTSFVEIVSTCNAGWKMSPEKANEWMEENLFKTYPLGDLKDIEE